ncbi:glycosyltransferase family protein, partial [Aspergillus glaucus CBS 516.65]
SISQNTKLPKCRPKHSPIHLLVVLGSGGHTAEMFSMLRRMQLNTSRYSYRTYVVSSGDDFSAAKAIEFEKSLQGEEDDTSYTIVTVPRARRVHQFFLTAPLSTLQCFWACVRVLCGRYPDQKPLPLCYSSYPDLILTNGPATAVCVILAAKFLRLFSRYAMKEKKQGDKPTVQDIRLRTIFVESWARVTTLSLSGKLLLPFVDRFLVQWPALGGKAAWWSTRKTEYAGALVD